MSTQPPPRPSIQELGLNDPELVKLHLELIRIIEKDIDEIKEGDAKSGWTSWALIGGIAGALLVLFGETRKLQAFPVNDVTVISLAGILLYNIVVLLYNILTSSGSPNIRPGRVKWSRDVFFPLLPVAAYRLIIFIVATLLAFTLPIPYVAKIITIVTFCYWTLWPIVLPIYALVNYPLGNRKEFKRFGLAGLISVLSLSIISLIFLVIQMHFPLGELATLPFILAGLIVTITILIENLISTLVPSSLLSNLVDLRNDIIFLRADIDEALQRYEVIQDGETLPIALREELNEIISSFTLIEYAYANMNTLLEKIEENLPFLKGAQEVKQQKEKQLYLDIDSYSLHKTKCDEFYSSLNKKIQKFNKKLSRVLGASGDVVGENTIRSFIGGKFQQLVDIEKDLNKRLLDADYHIKNPDKIPERVPSSTGN